MAWILLFVAIIFEVVATSFLKIANGFSRMWPWAVLVPCYALSLYLMSQTLEVLPVGVVYAIWAGSGDALMVAVGRFYFKEALDRPALIGVFMIALGVIVLQAFSR